MGKLSVINSNMYRKDSTGGDFNRQLGVLKDTIVKVTAAQEISKIIPTGFKFLIGSHELEVYVNGVYKRINVLLDGSSVGDYSEYSNFSVLFNAGQIVENDLVRFRVTTANYKIVNTPSVGTNIDPSLFVALQNDVAALNILEAANAANIQQIGRDSFGYNYAFNISPAGSTRTIGIMSGGDATPNISTYRVWKTSLAGATITNFDGCVSEDVRHIIFSNGNTTIRNNANIILSKGVDLVGEENKTITFVYDGSVWYELSGGNLEKVSDTLVGADWILDGGTGLYYADLNISSILSTDYTITCKDTVTNKIISPYDIEVISTSTVRIWMQINTVSIRATIIG